MDEDEAEVGGRGWQKLPRLAAAAMTVPVVVGFVALGAAVLVARSVRAAARQTLAWTPWPRRNTRDGPGASH